MNLTDKLLQIDKETLKGTMTETYHSKKLEKLCGDGTVEYKKLNERRLNDLQVKNIDDNGKVVFGQLFETYLMVIMEAVTNPYLKDPSLMEHFNCATPKDLTEMIFEGEIRELATTIMGEDTNVEDTVKN